jgi:hypothetical protein
MNLDEVQSKVVAQISAASALIAFGVPFAFSWLDNEETIKTAITARLLASGVSIEVGAISGGGRSGAPGRGQILDVTFPVWLAENPALTHAPSGLTLIQAVISAVCKGLPGGETAPVSAGFESAIIEQGYILHVLTFSVPVRIV